MLSSEKKPAQTSIFHAAETEPTIISDGDEKENFLLSRFLKDSAVQCSTNGLGQTLCGDELPAKPQTLLQAKRSPRNDSSD